MDYIYHGGGKGKKNAFYLTVKDQPGFGDTISGHFFSDLVRPDSYGDTTRKWILDPVYSYKWGIVKFTDTLGRVWRRF